MSRQRTGAGKDLTQREIALLFGVQEQNVMKWVARGMPASKSENGRVIINSAKATQWLEAQAAARAAVAKPADLDEARARKTAAEAELAEIAVAKARREVVEIALVAKAVSDEYAATRAKLLALPSKLGPMVAIETNATACQDLIERGIVEALEELSADAAAIADVGAGEGASGELEAAAETDGLGVG